MYFSPVDIWANAQFAFILVYPPKIQTGSETLLRRHDR
jgi:hypothetical protein